MDYQQNTVLLKKRVEDHAFVCHISRHRLSDGTLDVAGNLKLWNDGMEGFVKTPLWGNTPGWDDRDRLQMEPYFVFVPAPNDKKQKSDTIDARRIASCRPI